MTKRQEYAIGRARRNGGTAFISPDLAKQLVKRGIATLTGRKRQRMEYNQPVKGTTLWQVQLTSNA